MIESRGVESTPRPNNVVYLALRRPVDLQLAPLSVSPAANRITPTLSDSARSLRVILRNVFNASPPYQCAAYGARSKYEAELNASFDELSPPRIVLAEQDLQGLAPRRF
jgi:hypothetical protein